MNTTKAGIRLNIKNLLASADKEYKYNSSREITRKVLSLFEYKSAENICIYMSTQNEVDTSGIISEALHDGKKVFIPKIVDGKMMLNRLHPNTEFVLNKYNILEAADEKAICPKLDLIIAPLMAFDDNLNRLGHGGGYYDRFMADSRAVKLAMAFYLQKVDKVPTEIFDVKMDIIITERLILRKEF